MEKIDYKVVKTTINKVKYEVEIISDSENVYESGEQMAASDLIDDFCGVSPHDLDDVSSWLRSIPIPEAIKYIAEAWGIEYKLHKISTTEEIV